VQLAAAVDAEGRKVRDRGPGAGRLAHAPPRPGPEARDRPVAVVAEEVAPPRCGDGGAAVDVAADHAAAGLVPVDVGRPHDLRAADEPDLEVVRQVAFEPAPPVIRDPRELRGRAEVDLLALAG